jgi:serine/threonine protein kinase
VFLLVRAAGIVHRDIKLANIFIGKEHVFVLGDFGLVYVPHREPPITRRHGETVGAGDFIPPATWRGWGVHLAYQEHEVPEEAAPESLGWTDKYGRQGGFCSDLAKR